MGNCHLGLMGDFRYMPQKPSFVVFSNLETFEELGQLCRCGSADAHGELVTLHGATQLTERRTGL